MITAHFFGGAEDGAVKRLDSAPGELATPRYLNGGADVDGFDVYVLSGSRLGASGIEVVYRCNGAAEGH